MAVDQRTLTCVKACYDRVLSGRDMHVADSTRWRVLGFRSGPGGWPGEAPDWL